MRHPEVDIVYGHSLLVGPSATRLHVLWGPPSIGAMTDSVTPFDPLAPFFRRGVLEAGFDGESLDYVMDDELWRAQLALERTRIACDESDCCRGLSARWNGPCARCEEAAPNGISCDSQTRSWNCR